MNRHALSINKHIIRCHVSGQFRLRHFNLSHHLSSQKLGTDSLLLGAWASQDILSRWNETVETHRALDIGTGSGFLAMSLAQETCLANRELLVDAIDVDAGTCDVARSNVEASPWPSRITVQHISFQDLLETGNHGQSFEFLISNPPYFARSTKPPSDRRATARHQDTAGALPFSTLASGASKLLSPHPTSALYLVLPTSECKLFCSEAETYGLELSRLLKVRTIASDVSDKRRIMRFSKRGAEACLPTEEELVVSEERYDEEMDKRYWINTEAYDRLTSPFHHPDHIGKRRY
jgi:tRNA1Val (adenine37-N6)-methyltransferase